MKLTITIDLDDLDDRRLVALPHTMPFGDICRQARINAGYTQRELGALLGHSGRTSVSHFETGEHVPDIATLKKVLEACGGRLVITALVQDDRFRL